MKKAYDIIVEPVITEKATVQKEANNQVSFKVHPTSTKHEIKRAVEKIFDVTVLDIRTIRMRGKVKRMGRFQGRRPTWKKAIVTLKPGDKIEYFEGV